MHTLALHGHLAGGVNGNAAQQHMQLQHGQPPTSVAMAISQSQQGTNGSVGTGSQGTSANASPNVSSKRRRPSGVKVEGEEGGGGTADINGVGAAAAKVKASPRPGGKKQKINA